MDSSWVPVHLHVQCTTVRPCLTVAVSYDFFLSIEGVAIFEYNVHVAPRNLEFDA